MRMFYHLEHITSIKKGLIMEGLVHIYIGDGKGKTTAALGLALRAAGAGLSVWYCQFLKQEESCELAALAHVPNITVQKGEPTDGFLFAMDEAQRAHALESARRRLARAREAMESGRYDMVVLDEFLWLLTNDAVTTEEALAMIAARSRGCELVLTGGFAPDELIDAADYVSEIAKRKHPFDRDLPARRGIEF